MEEEELCASNELIADRPGSAGSNDAHDDQELQKSQYKKCERKGVVKTERKSII